MHVFRGLVDLMNTQMGYLYSCLFDRGHHEWVRIDEHLVHHDASLSGRISDVGSYRKKMGLLKFAEKYRSIMTEEIWEEFVHISITSKK